MFDKSIEVENISDLNPLDLLEYRNGDETKYLSFRTKRIFKDNEIKDLIITVNDVSESIKLERQLEETAEQSKKQVEMLNLIETDRRIRIAGKFLASFEPERIMVCSVRRYGRNPVRKFCEVTGSTAFADRFIPGTLTNPLIDQFHEADVLLMIDPHADKQALSEAKLARIPVVSFIDTDDYLYDIDLAIPANNRGRKSLCRMLWLLARQIMRERGKIPPDGDIDLTVNDFESKISRPEPEA